jgi:predicted transglutaminase-like cysteine proteinase
MTDEELLELCKETQAKCWGLFNYVHDDKQYMMEEHWTSHADEVNEGKEFTDDCDGFALTCAELLMQAGVPKDKLSAVYCVTETGEGHLVTGVVVGDKTIIMENRFKKVYDWNHNPGYTWILFMKFSEAGTWRKVENAQYGNQ